MRMTWLVFLVLTAAVVGIAVLGLLRLHPDPIPFPDFSLVDQDGLRFERADLISHVWLANFISTTCTGPCLVVGGHLKELQGKLPPSVRLVSFTVEPKVDTPEVLATYAKKFPWTFVTGEVEPIREIARESLDLGQRGEGEEASFHHAPIVLVDRTGRIRGRYRLVSADQRLDTGVLDRLASDTRFQVNLSFLPFFHAALNGTSALLLLVGFAFIRMKRIRAHLTCMLLALTATSLFLASYLYYHFHAGSVPFPAQGWVRSVYFTILISHTVLAAFVAPLAGTVLYHAARRQFDHHRKIARWTLPIWLYVSLTGVLVYLMLYVWFADG